MWDGLEEKLSGIVGRVVDWYLDHPSIVLVGTVGFLVLLLASLCILVSLSGSAGTP
jgi:uncharacterized membrane protein YdfJ with MMPL/SSD domain